MPREAVPPAYETKYPWTNAPEMQMPNEPYSPLAPDPNYREPKDLFEEGNHRLEEEGVLSIKHPEV
jgi:hypothetical protein